VEANHRSVYEPWSHELIRVAIASPCHEQLFGYGQPRDRDVDEGKGRRFVDLFVADGLPKKAIALRARCCHDNIELAANGLGADARQVGHRILSQVEPDHGAEAAQERVHS
jgi:hypothetical protein